MSETLAIRGEGLGKVYRHFRVFQGIHLEVRPGECYALFGPNGAGKTTLLKILATVHSPTEGRFWIAGWEGLRQRDQARAHLLFVGHGIHLYEDLTALENLQFFLGLRGIRLEERVLRKALDRVGIGPFAHFPVRQFSAGMKKRLSLCRAILVRPSVLILDEPYSSLDARGIRMWNGFLREFTGKGGAVLMTVHDPHHPQEVVHRAGLLQGGRLREIPLSVLQTSHELF